MLPPCTACVCTARAQVVRDDGGCRDADGPVEGGWIKGDWGARNSNGSREGRFVRRDLRWTTCDVRGKCKEVLLTAPGKGGGAGASPTGGHRCCWCVKRPRCRKRRGTPTHPTWQQTLQLLACCSASLHARARPSYGVKPSSPQTCSLAALRALARTQRGHSFGIPWPRPQGEEHTAARERARSWPLLCWRAQPRHTQRRPPYIRIWRPTSSALRGCRRSTKAC